MSYRSVILLVLILSVVPCSAGDLMVYTANQGFLSRIYILDMNGSVVRFFEYSYDHTFLDLEVIAGEVYVLDWVPAAVYRVDIETGALEIMVADIVLDLVQGVAFDGTYFYLDEFNLRRYRFDGTFDGSASFGEDVMGSAWDGNYLWTMDGGGQVKCFDLSAWPNVVAVPANDFSAPSPECRGLWFDGEHFWSAESIEDNLGWIFKFDHTGAVVSQWLEPAYQGWSACMVRDPQPIFSDGFESGNLSGWN